MKTVLIPRLAVVALVGTALSLAACSPAPSEQADAETAATMPVGANTGPDAIEPGVGAVVNEGGGVPGASTGNPAAAPSVSSPPDNAQEAQQTPERAPQ